MKSIIDQLGSEDVYITKACNCPACVRSGDPSPLIIPTVKVLVGEYDTPVPTLCSVLWLWSDTEALEEDSTIDPNEFMIITISEASELMAGLTDFMGVPSFLRILPEDKTIPVKNPLAYA